MSREPDVIQQYANSRIISAKSPQETESVVEIIARLAKTLQLLPDTELELFLSGKRSLSIEIIPDPRLPFGMKTRSSGELSSRKYRIFICEECSEWPENRFFGALLRELGHVVVELPPEEEWPIVRGDRARFKESAELLADCLVWKWGLRHYGMTYLVETYPAHWVDRIVSDIENMIETDDRFK